MAPECAAAMAEYLEHAIKEMRKRAWDLDADGNVFEHPDGSIPVWWLREEIERLRRLAQKGL